MSENRRDAWRLSHNGIGWLAAKGFRAACKVEDISVSGARVNVASIRMHGSQLPRELTLTTMLGGEQVTVPGEVTRIQNFGAGLSLAIHFFNGDSANLGWLMCQAQRELINSGALVRNVHALSA